MTPDGHNPTLDEAAIRERSTAGGSGMKTLRASQPLGSLIFIHRLFRRICWNTIPRDRFCRTPV